MHHFIYVAVSKNNGNNNLFKLSDRVNMFVEDNNNNSQVAAIALGPYTMHPEQWAETLTNKHTPYNEHEVSVLLPRHLNSPLPPATPCSSPDAI